MGTWSDFGVNSIQLHCASSVHSRLAFRSAVRGNFGVVFESHDTSAANIQQVANFQNEGILVLVEPSVSVRNLPQQSNDPCFLGLGKVIVQELLCEVIQMRDVLGGLARVVDKVGAQSH